MEIPGWLSWIVVPLGIWLWAKAYGYLRDNHGSDEGSWLEGIGAMYVATFVAPFMPFILIRQWWKRRHARAGIVHEANRLPSGPSS